VEAHSSKNRILLLFAYAGEALMKQLKQVFPSTTLLPLARQCKLLRLVVYSVVTVDGE
jgi:hypothetical protein